MDKQTPHVVATTTIFIEAEPDKVWAVLAQDFAGIAEWSSGVSHAEGFGSPIGSSPYSKRACEITAAGFNDTQEEILEFDQTNYHLRYSLFSGLPGFVKDAENIWELKPQNGGTYLFGKTSMRATGFMGFTMKGMMKTATRKALNNMAEELKYFLETGKPHPDKVSSNEKLARKDEKIRRKVVSFEIIEEIDAPLAVVWKTLAGDFGEVYKSNPVSDYSVYAQGFDQPQLGAQRIMYMSKDRKKYFVDRLAKWEEEKHLTIEIVDKKGFPIRPNYTWLNMDLEKLGEGKTQLKIRFNYLTKPAFLKGLAKNGLKKNFREYAWAIDYHCRTGEIITRENWKEIRKNYL
ncbi:MAG: SRPBCC family protein [Bacteroidota bacterium]